MKVKIVKLDSKAVIPYKTHDSDFCYDVVATSCEQIAPNVYRYGTGLSFQIERGPETVNEKVVYKSGNTSTTIYSVIPFKGSPLRLSIDARPRSSVWKTGMVLANCEGTIDEDYTGEVSAVFYHVLPDMPKYEVGDRICQIKIGITTPIDFEEVDELESTERGSGREGSTGK
jgi:dUTP pyrophosphatase